VPGREWQIISVAHECRARSRGAQAGARRDPQRGVPGGNESLHCTWRHRAVDRRAPRVRRTRLCIGSLPRSCGRARSVQKVGGVILVGFSALQGFRVVVESLIRQAVVEGVKGSASEQAGGSAAEGAGFLLLTGAVGEEKGAEDGSVDEGDEGALGEGGDAGGGAAAGREGGKGGAQVCGCVIGDE